MSLVSVLQTAFTRIATEFNDIRSEITAAGGTGTGIRVSDLTAVSAAATTDTFPVVSGGTTKKETNAQLITLLQTLGMPRVKRVSSQHAISSTTGTEVTDLKIALEAGTYTFRYTILCRSATGTVGPMFGVNFTGTGAPRMHFRFADASTATTAEVHSMDDEGNKAFGFISGMATSTESTTAPNMGTTVGVATTGVDILCFVEGIIVVTATGDLEFWHSSETATSTSVEVGTNLVVVRTA